MPSILTYAYNATIRMDIYARKILVDTIQIQTRHLQGYEQPRDGVIPTGCRTSNWQAGIDGCVAIKGSMCRVEAALSPDHILDCKANPHQLVCRK